MEQRLSRFGVGPWLSAAMIATGAAAGFATYAWPDVCVLGFIPYDAVAPLGWAFIVAGAALWAAGLIAVHRAYNSDRLVTSGAFAVVRHPVYAAWLTLMLPGITLLTRSWPVALVPVAVYLVFKRMIRTEDEYLTKRFGQEYLDYRSRVNEVLPMPRKRP
jgi:protein-S-isoprenylcysteine O-methyltransferase Ste14